ncbi:LCP family protein [Jongsikchunia kroppenstedtii]|uniref:LCP family protein n=1 Tax=Jongsikchunia kroppenstedtii TaxID=1121721 RepID=UPI000367F3D4|nr:LCP family protein [Jongsikchunia kroppenstedtii]
MAATRPPRRPGGSGRWALRSIVAVATVAVLVATGVSWTIYRHSTSGFTRSGALAGGPTSKHGDQNILVMGLDSRLDEHGNPLPQAMYDALHAGSADDGGMNANVLMLLHVPGDGSKATAISIPRDDYVNLDGCPSNNCQGKIKQAYGFAYAEKRQSLSAQGDISPDDLESQSREAGRRSEIATVRQFLGNVPIDHFIEVTLAAFFQVAEVVQPITVCLNQDTSDSYSGARFHKGVQKINASQAMAFVRQRRDPNPDLNFTDLDRDRRQQAFVISLMQQLTKNGTLTNLGQMNRLLNVAKANIAFDDGFDLVKFATTSSNLTGGNVTFFTLPIDHFGANENGEDVNFVNLPQIHSIVRQVLGPDAVAPETSTSSTNTAAPQAITGADGKVLNVVNSSGENGMAAQYEELLAARGFTRGSASTGSTIDSTTQVEYGSGAQGPATELAQMLGGSVTAEADTSLEPNSVRLIIGTDLPDASALGQSSTTSSESDDTDSSTGPTDPNATESVSAPSGPAQIVNGTGTGANAPAPTDLVNLTNTASVPCVK